MDIKETVKKELDSLLKVMNIDTTYSISQEMDKETTYVSVCFEGEKLGYLIGNHGKHLDSLQYILQMLVRKNFEDEKDFRVVLDVCDYRKERNEKLEKMALQKADDARILGDAVELPPMKPFDRRAVHLFLEKFDDIKTESVGEEPYRYIRIIPKRDSEVDMLSEDLEESEE
jgi:spoIIIJ-associated protein